ncbi:MAG: sigma-70 family RNA polymerase sigma factor [Gemmataceae bacterium]
MMACKTVGGLVRHFEHLAAEAATASLSDRDLLLRFRNSRDEGAFTALLQRHGSMVYHTCRRTLANDQDAEDAWQQTFLLLVARAGVGRWQESLAGWLHETARRISLKTRTATIRRLAREQRHSRQSGRLLLDEISGRELQTALDEQLARLPARVRVPLVLCYLEGLTRDEAARQLGCPLSTLKLRVQQGRDLLQKRLQKRGLALSAALAAAMLITNSSRAAVPATLVHATLEAALHLASKPLAGAVISANALALARRVLKTLLLSKPKLAASILAIGLFAAGAGLLALPKEPRESADDRQSSLAEQKPLPPEKDKHREAVDQFGDALPPGALARLGTIRWRLDPHGAECMAFSRDGNTLLTGNSQTGITIWEMQTGRVLRRLPEKPELRKAWLGYDTVVALAADGQSAAFGTSDGTLQLVDLETGKSAVECRGHSGRIQEAALSADGKVLASRSTDKTLRVWDTQTGKELRQLPIHELARDVYRPAQIALSRDAKLLAWVGPFEKRSIHILDIAKNRETVSLDVSGQSHCFISFSPDGTKLISTGDGGPSQVWEVATGKELRHVPALKNFIPSATFGPDSKVLLHTRGGEKMALLDLSTGGEIWQHPRAMSSTRLDVAAFPLDGKTVVIARGDSQVLHQYDVATGKQLLPRDESQKGFRAIAFGSGEKMLLTTGADGVLRTWDARSGKEMGHFKIDLSGWCVFSRDGKKLALTKEGRVFVFDTATGKETHRFGDQSNDWHQLQFSADATLLLDYGTSKGTLIWRLARSGKPSRIETPEDRKIQLAFSSDSRSLIGHHSVDEKQGGNLITWDLETGRVRQTAALPPTFLNEVVLSPDGKAIALCGDQPFHQNAIYICEVNTGAKRIEIKRDEYVFPPSMRFSPDGLALIVNGGPNASAEVYDAFTGQRLNRQEGHRGGIGIVAFSPSGKLVATTSSDTTALVWDAASFLRLDKRQTLKLTSDELNGLWSDLADSERACQAMDKMIRSPHSSVDFLNKRLKPVSIRDDKDLSRVDQLVQELDNETFAVRENAAASLEKLGNAAAPALQGALAKKPSAEVTRRLERLLAKIEDEGQSGELLRDLRSLEILEHIANAQAKNLFERLSTGAPQARLTIEAQASLARLLNKGK